MTVRERPVADRATATVGGVTIHSETLDVQTDHRVELVDLTKRVMEFVAKGHMHEGLVSLWSMHTTCALFINEFQTALLTDIKRWLERLVMRDAAYVHNDPEHALSDGAQSLEPGTFSQLMAELRIIAPAIGRRIA